MLGFLEEEEQEVVVSCTNLFILGYLGEEKEKISKEHR